MELARVAGLANGWKFVGEEVRSGAGASVSTAGDIDGDGAGDILIGTRRYGGTSVVFLVSGARLPAADEADGSVDGIVDLGRVASLADCWKIVGAADAAAAGDVDGDGIADLLIRGGPVYLVSAAALAFADSADGSSDGVVELAHVAGQLGVWEFVVEQSSFFHNAGGVGDLDGDGSPDVAFGVQRNRASRSDDRDAVYFVSATDLPILDAADGNSDGVVQLNVVQQRAPWEATF